MFGGWDFASGFPRIGWGQALLPTERHRKPSYLNASICRAFQGRFFVTLPIWKLILINLSSLYQKIATANIDSRDSIFKMAHKVFNLVFHTGWKTSLQRKGTCGFIPGESAEVVSLNPQEAGELNPAQRG